jgi:SAM-dependent methyltransferase
MEYYEQIPGWFDYQNIYDEQVARARSGAVFVEIGAYLGRSTAYLAARIKQSRKRIRLYVVDLWDGWFWNDDSPDIPMHAGPEVFWHFMRNMRCQGLDEVICPLKMSSDRAALLFEEGSLDFVFVDGDHGYAAVQRDLTAWFPRVKPGGVLAGHDYINNDFPGVRRAADEFFLDLQLPLEENGTSFVVHKPGSHWLRRAVRACRRLLAPARV